MRSRICAERSGAWFIGIRYRRHRPGCGITGRSAIATRDARLRAAPRQSKLWCHGRYQQWRRRGDARPGAHTPVTRGRRPRIRRRGCSRRSWTASRFTSPAASGVHRSADEGRGCHHFFPSAGARVGDPFPASVGTSTDCPCPSRGHLARRHRARRALHDGYITFGRPVGFGARRVEWNARDIERVAGAAASAERYSLRQRCSCCRHAPAM